MSTEKELIIYIPNSNYKFALVRAIAAKNYKIIISV